MAAAPTDADGRVTPHDDNQAIPDDALLVRYIPSKHLIEMADGSRRLSKAAFSASSKRNDPYEGMSVDMLAQLERDGVDPSSRMSVFHEGAVTIKVGDLRKLGLLVAPDPQQIGDPYHASVWGVKSGHRKKVLKISRWHIKPPDVV